MGVIMRVPGLMKGKEMDTEPDNEYSIYGALNTWFVANKKRIYQEYGLNLSVGVENEFWQSHGHHE
jgi:hypothetical protein